MHKRAVEDILPPFELVFTPAPADHKATLLDTKKGIDGAVLGIFIY